MATERVMKFEEALRLNELEWRSTAGYFVTVAVVLFCLVKVVGGRRSAKLPPGPKALPLIGNLHQVSELSHRTLWDMAKQYGPIMYLQMGVNPLVVVSSADAAQEFCKVQDKAWSGRPTTIAGKIFSNNYRNIVHAPNGSHWRHMRKICTTELFTPKRLESFRAPRTEEFSQMVRSIYEDSIAGKPVKLTVKLGHLATNNITRMLLGKRFFGTDVEGQMEAHRFKELIFKLFHISTIVMVGDFLPWLKWATDAFGYPGLMRQVKSDMDACLQQFIDVKKAGGSSMREDFVDLLLAQPNDTNTGRLDDDAINGVIQDMLLAGTDTSSNTVEWAIAELLRNPNCMHKLQSELDEVVGKDQIVSETDIANLPYLQAVTKEILRLYPPAPLDLPHASIEPSTVWGYELPAQTQLFVNLYAIQRDPKVWDRPDQFDPQRFLDRPEVGMGGNHFGLIPFGAGRRQCPGMPLGILFVQLGIARLAQSFDFTLPDAQDPSSLDMTEKFGITMPRKNPLTVVATARLPANLY
ncbi:hypothetical protein M758_11G023900 [Ceratodon purpureus]|nr:hypothetical protein M758_11G023900 [Ceratodon purpureus]